MTRHHPALLLKKKALLVRQDFWGPETPPSSPPPVVVIGVVVVVLLIVLVVMAVVVQFQSISGMSARPPNVPKSVLIIDVVSSVRYHQRLNGTKLQKHCNKQRGRTGNQAQRVTPNRSIFIHSISFFNISMSYYSARWLQVPTYPNITKWRQKHCNQQTGHTENQVKPGWSWW